MDFCERCKKEYVKERINQKYCCKYCRYNELNEIEKWLAKEYKAPSSVDPNQPKPKVFGKKWGVSTKLKVCGG